MKEKKTTTNVIGYDYNPTFNEFIVYEQILKGYRSKEVVLYTIPDIIGEPEYGTEITNGKYIGEQRKTIKMKTFNSTYMVYVDTKQGKDKEEYINRISGEEQLSFLRKRIFKKEPGSFEIQRSKSVRKQVNNPLPLFSPDFYMLNREHFKVIEGGGKGGEGITPDLKIVRQIPQDITQEIPNATVHYEL